jgi:predicted Zn-dependent protease
VHEPEHAREAFESGLRHSNGSEALSLGLAELYEQMGQYERALATVRRLARDADDVLLVQDTLARLAERRGAFTEALAARRARVARLCARDTSERTACDQETTRVRALTLLIGGAERLSVKQCAARGDSLVLSVLLGCR